MRVWVVKSLGVKKKKKKKNKNKKAPKFIRLKGGQN
jgi:hypothetical protein